MQSRIMGRRGTCFLIVARWPRSTACSNLAGYCSRCMVQKQEGPWARGVERAGMHEGRESPQGCGTEAHTSQLQLQVGRDSDGWGGSPNV